MLPAIMRRGRVGVPVSHFGHVDRSCRSIRLMTGDFVCLDRAGRAARFGAIGHALDREDRGEQHQEQGTQVDGHNGLGKDRQIQAASKQQPRWTRTVIVGCGARWQVARKMENIVNSL